MTTDYDIDSDIHSETAATRKPARRKFPARLVVFFILLLAAAGVAWNSVKHPPAPAPATPAITDAAPAAPAVPAVPARNKQETLGWQGKLVLQKRLFSFALRDKDGAPIQGAETKIWVVRPLDRQSDQFTVMTETAPGMYQADFSKYAAGQWMAHVTAKVDGKQFQISQTFDLQ